MKQIVALAMLLMLACTSVKPEVRYNFDKGVDFSIFKTYKWVTLKNSPTMTGFSS
jgi:hypothetical protein